MATTLKRTQVSSDLLRIANNAVESVRVVRAAEQSRLESEFQRAVAGGMTYEAQIEFRKKQLEEQSASPFFDATYSESLTNSIAATQKLSRYEKIRIKYKSSLDDYAAGKESMAQHIALLEGILETEKDPTLSAEVRTQLSDAHTQQTTIQLNAIKNRAILAGKDKSIPLIDSSIDEVRAKRALASINKNDDEVAMWDDTLLALRGNKSKLQIDNGLNEIVFQSNQKDIKANDKLGILNNYIGGADASSPVTYDGVSYPSLKAFWENKRGEYISSGYLAEIKKELDADTSRIAATSLYGQIPVPRIDAVNKFYSDIATRPEFAPFAAKIEQQRVESLNTMVTDLASSIYNEATSTGNQASAQSAIASLENKFGIKVAREAFTTETKNIAATTEKAISEIKPVSTVTTTPTLPTTTAPEAPAPTPTPTIPTAETVAPTGSYTVKTGDQLKDIAARQGMTLSSLLDLNPDLKANPNLIKPGQNIVLPATPAKVETPVAPTAPIAPTAPVEKPVTTQTPPVVTTPVATPQVPAQKTYVVKPGETLSSIALSQLGDASKAFSLKRDTGETFDETTAKKLQVGTKLIIPNQ